MLEIKLPNIETQQAVVTALATIDQKIVDTENKLAALKEEKEALL